MKSKLLSFSAAVIAIGLLLSGCASGKTADAQIDVRDDNFVEATQGGAVEAPGNEDNSASPALDLGELDTTGKKIIYTANITVEVDDATETIKEISATAAALGGYVSDSTFTRDDEIASGTITIRIKPEQYTTLTEKIGTLGEVLDSSLTSQDVTYDYVDIESRLKNAEAQETQLLAIMDKAVEIEDILKVRTELNTVQQEIEQYQGQLRYMDNLVGYSTVTIRVTEKFVPKAPEVKENEGVIARWSSSYVWKSIVKGFNNSVAFIVNFFSVLLIIISYLLIPALIIVPVILVLRFIIRKLKKGKGKGSGNPPAPPVLLPKDNVAVKEKDTSPKD